MKIKLLIMKKNIFTYICFILLLCSCSKKSSSIGENIEALKEKEIIRKPPESKIIQVNPWKNDSTILTLKYKTSGMKYKHEFYSASYPESNLLLNEVLTFAKSGIKRIDIQILDNMKEIKKVLENNDFKEIFSSEYTNDINAVRYCKMFD